MFVWRKENATPGRRRLFKVVEMATLSLWTSTQTRFFPTGLKRVVLLGSLIPVHPQCVTVCTCHSYSLHHPSHLNPLLSGAYCVAQSHGSVYVFYVPGLGRNSGSSYRCCRHVFGGKWAQSLIRSSDPAPDITTRSRGSPLPSRSSLSILTRLCPATPPFFSEMSYRQRKYNG